MTRNITLKLDEDLLTDVRVLAARRNTSVSQLLADLLEEHVRRDRSYERARRRALRRLADPPTLNWTPPADRGELHER